MSAPSEIHRRCLHQALRLPVYFSRMTCLGSRCLACDMVSQHGLICFTPCLACCAGAPHGFFNQVVGKEGEDVVLEHQKVLAPAEEVEKAWQNLLAFLEKHLK